jgi:hypothetical protein
MISFKKFLPEEVVNSKRVSIQHFQKMKSEEFVAWMKTVRFDYGGVLKNIKAVMKVDGLGARFGKDFNGTPFFEGSRTGPVFDSGGFSAFARCKTDNIELITRAVHYDNMLEIFKKEDFMNTLPNNTKVVCEIFYNPMAETTEKDIKFVTVSYDKKRLGSLMTIMPYTVLDASTGHESPDKDNILKKLYKRSSDKIMIINPNLKFTEIDVSVYAEAASVYSDESLSILKSRKSSDRADKQNLINALQKIKDDLADYLLAHPGIEGKFKLGTEIEGVVLHLPDRTLGTLPYKITTPEFKSAHAKQKG